MFEDRRLKIEGWAKVTSAAKEIGEMGQVLTNCLAFMPQEKVGTVRLNFWGWRKPELQRVIEGGLSEGQELYIIGHLEGTYDEKPGINVRYCRSEGMEFFIDTLYPEDAAKTR
jgi:hypothetical protein